MGKWTRPSLTLLSGLEFLYLGLRAALQTREVALINLQRQQRALITSSVISREAEKLYHHPCPHSTLRSQEEVLILSQQHPDISR